jgi:hypothetical protein
MSGVALCRLPTQACAGCEEFFLDEELEQLYSGSLDLYCSDCVHKAQNASDERRDAEHYG